MTKKVKPKSWKVYAPFDRGHLINLGPPSKWWTPVYRSRANTAKQWPGHEIESATLTFTPKPKRKP